MYTVNIRIYFHIVEKFFFSSIAVYFMIFLERNSRFRIIDFTISNR